ncbi:glycosyltransferase-like protein [Fibrella aestuarina BUZ 2]|uniref:Glycosyltransferase-like protein n=1 Tax=Fibrella aestuarina BUZ 2 TaxID=1166018 RepID=I0KFR2_9BACT|nr:glycosyltransferase-like protein [Fibrella aestuarina]CCH02965.1 glycosyltransferase-like protein [Fibrella aestuarina BUZ 2]
MEKFIRIPNTGQNEFANIRNENSFLDDVLFVITLYKTELPNSITFNSLKKFIHTQSIESPRADLALMDNSPISDFSSIEQLNINWLNIYYFHDPSNPGVSKSYNRAADLATTLKKKWLLLLDQDSLLPDNGLEKYQIATSLWKGHSVYAPILRSQKIILSPCAYHFFRASHLKKIGIGINTTHNRNVLNSGLLIDIESFDMVGRYDENVWLYFSDFVFFNRLKKHYKHFVIVDIHIEHDLSSADYVDINIAKERFELYCDGAFLAYKSERSSYSLICYTATIGLRSLLMSLRLRKITFLSIFYKKFLSRK